MRILLSISIVGIILLGGGMVFAQQSVTLDQASPIWYVGDEAKLPVGQEVTFKLRFTNINGEGSCYNVQSLFTVSSPDGATWGNTVMSLEPGFADLFDRVFSYEEYAPSPGSGTDSVGAAGIVIFYPVEMGICDGYDDVAMTITITPDAASAGKHICLDAVTDGSGPSGFQWYWPSVSIPFAYPEWGGPYTFEVADAPCIPPEFTENNPTEIRSPYCEPIGATFEAAWPDGGECHGDISYAIMEGPGTIDPASGVWSWDDATIADHVGEAVPLVIKTCGDLVCRTKTFYVTPTYGVPAFTAGCDQTVELTAGDTAQIGFAVESVCPDASLDFFVADDDGAGGSYSFSGTTLRWYSAESSAGIWTWTIGASSGTDTGYCTVDLAVHAPGACCGLYTGGYTGNVDCSSDGAVSLADIIRLIDNVYLSHQPLCCQENAYVAGRPNVELLEITTLIYYVYLSHGASPPPCGTW
jgi:hypothetical protein